MPQLIFASVPSHAIYSHKVLTKSFTSTPSPNPSKSKKASFLMDAHEFLLLKKLLYSKLAFSLFSSTHSASEAEHLDAIEGNRVTPLVFTWQQSAPRLCCVNMKLVYSYPLPRIQNLKTNNIGSVPERIMITVQLFSASPELQ